MDLGLRGRNCIVTGASRGIALGLAAEGANLAICSRTEGPLRQTEAELRATGVSVHAEPCDVGDTEALTRFLDGARTALGGVDILIHNASALALGPELDAWQRCLAVDLMAAVHACERVLPWMIEAGRGCILFISSISGLEATPTPDLAYATAKAGLLAYAKKLALLHGAHDHLVNALAPGSIEVEGELWAAARLQQPSIYQTVRAAIPSGRLGTVEEVADAAVYLVSARTSWITGTTLIVDGGQHCAIH